jgi:hypothetical protein
MTSAATAAAPVRSVRVHIAKSFLLVVAHAHGYPARWAIPSFPTADMERLVIQ